MKAYLYKSTTFGQVMAKILTVRTQGVQRKNGTWKRNNLSEFSATLQRHF